MIKTEEKAIGAHTYRVTQLGAKRGRQVLTRLARAFGSGGNLLANLREEDVDFLCDTFAEFTQVNIGGKWPSLPGIMEVHFAGNYTEMIQWMRFCVEVNFAGFFEDLPSLLAGRGAKDSSGSESPTE